MNVRTSAGAYSNTKKNYIVIYNMVYCDMQIYVRKFVSVLLTFFVCIYTSIAYSNSTHALINGSCTFLIFIQKQNIHRIAIKILYASNFISTVTNGLMPNSNLLIFSLFHYFNRIHPANPVTSVKTVLSRFSNVILMICLKQLLLFVNTRRKFSPKWGIGISISWSSLILFKLFVSAKTTRLLKNFIQPEICGCDYMLWMYWDRVR